MLEKMLFLGEGHFTPFSESEAKLYGIEECVRDAVRAALTAAHHRGEPELGVGTFHSLRTQAFYGKTANLLVLVQLAGDVHEYRGFVWMYVDVRRGHDWMLRHHSCFSSPERLRRCLAEGLEALHRPIPAEAACAG